MDISNFMTWFIQEIVKWFTFIFSTMNNLKFGGTSLLKVLVFINVIIPFLYVVLTINKAPTINSIERKANKDDTKSDRHK